MAKLKVQCEWDLDVQQAFNIPKGYLVFRYKKFYREQVTPYFLKLDKWQKKKEELKELDLTIEVHYKKRTLDMNNLMWALYDVEVNEQNADMEGTKNQMVNTEELYEADLLEYGERESVRTMAGNIPFYVDEFHVQGFSWKGKALAISELSQHIIQPDEEITIMYIRGTSKLNTVQMSKWIERQFNRLSEMGVSFENTSEIADYWIKYQDHKNEMTFQDTVLTVKEYRELNTICEAHGTHPGEHVAHINALGMGGNRTDKIHSSNALHLCAESHLGIQHQKGWTEFIKLFPHLKNKIESALKREYKTVEEQPKQLDIF